jgi:purine/pyrimidine-nucleoside phosphorylase
MDLKNVTVTRKAELSHGGRVSTRTVITADGEMKSLGLMQPGTYRFVTEAQETIEIVQGHCRVKLAGDQAWADYQAGQSFAVPAASHFEVEVDDVLDFISHLGASAEG